MKTQSVHLPKAGIPKLCKVASYILYTVDLIKTLYNFPIPSHTHSHIPEEKRLLCLVFTPKLLN